MYTNVVPFVSDAREACEGNLQKKGESSTLLLMAEGALIPSSFLHFHSQNNTFSEVSKGIAREHHSVDTL